MGKRHIRTRDYLMVRIIQGVTKSATHLDRKRESSRLWCRQGDEDEYTGEESKEVEEGDSTDHGGLSGSCEAVVCDDGQAERG
jgi:hypothetical protein